MNKKNKKQNKVRAHSLSFRNSWGVALILIIIITISSCRKYPEGGSYFLNSIDNEIIGTYNFTHYYIDGKDSVNYYFNPDGKLELGYYKQHTTHPLIIDSYTKNNYRSAGEWKWNSKNKKSINLTFPKSDRDTIIYLGPFTESNISIWDIKKLKDNELIIETDYNNKHYRAELKK